MITNQPSTFTTPANAGSANGMGMDRPGTDMDSRSIGR